MVKYAQTPTDVECYGHKFKWTPLHHTPEQLHRYVYSYDELSTRAMDRLDEMLPPPTEWSAPRKDIQESYEPKDKKNQRDFFKLIKKHAEDDEEIAKLWSQINTVPDWVDWEQIDRGQKVFWRHAGAIVTSVGHRKCTSSD
jgi:ketosteroid isomerase-like protein